MKQKRVHSNPTQQKEHELVQTLATAFAALPADKKEYLLGYADGVVAMAARARDYPESGPSQEQAG